FDPKDPDIRSARSGLGLSPMRNAGGPELPGVPTQPKANSLLSKLGMPHHEMKESIQKVGQTQYKARAEGEEPTLPKRVGGINLFRFAGDDTAKKELIAGAMLTND